MTPYYLFLLVPIAFVAMGFSFWQSCAYSAGVLSTLAVLWVASTIALALVG